MISVSNGLFHLRTEHTSYLMRITDTGHLVHLSYGAAIHDMTGWELLEEKGAVLSTVPYWDEEHEHLYPGNMLQEYPTPDRGDARPPAIAVEYGSGSLTLDLKVIGSRVMKGKVLSFPAHALPSDSTETLEIELSDRLLPILVTLRYTVYPECDVILRSARIANGTGNPVIIREAASLSLDIPSDGWKLHSFDGAWARERHENVRPLLPGTVVIDSRLGCSGNEHNPLVYLENGRGEVYGFNLIYSGNHRETVSVSPFGRTRVTQGINPFLFSWKLMPGESFETPEAIMTYSGDGIESAAQSFHSFIRTSIVRGSWKDRERPVLINNWEATYFDFTEERLLELADEAAALGIELFVLDDGWFGHRRDDRRGLGDWWPQPERLPDGLEGLSEKIRSRGLLFGIWVEPEMISIDSDLYRQHPDWVIAQPGRDPLPCRHQFVLDLSRPEVREYLFRCLSEVFRKGSVSYVKWDMNRTITDTFSSDPSVRLQGEVQHRYILGLYDLMGRLAEAFPGILFEGCASGGNRYDLGMLCFMPQIWTSDNTDVHDRVVIEEGTLRGYPQSTMGAHVSASPGHQSMRVSRIDSRFAVAAFGVLGYELDLTKLNDEDKGAIKRQICFYKKYRRILQQGRFSSLHVSRNQRFWYSSLGSTAIAVEIQTLNEVHTGRCDRLVYPDADESKRYRVTAVRESIPGLGMSEEFSVCASGTILRKYGIALAPQFTGNGVSAETRVLGDFGSRMYIIEEEKDEGACIR